MFKKIADFFKQIPGGVADFVINKVLFLFMGSKLKGYKTLIFNVGTMLLAVWEFLSKDGGLFDLLCSYSETFLFLIMFCEIDKGEFYAGAAVVITWINVLLRKLTDAPIGYKGPSNFTTHKVPTPASLVMVGSIGIFLSFIWRLFF